MNFSTIPDLTFLAPIVMAIVFGALVFAFPALGYLVVNGIVLWVAIRYLRAG